jgi:hypothetical protein
MPFRYRLLSATGDDLGPFVSGDTSWKVGDVIYRGASQPWVVTAVVEPEELADFHAYLVINELEFEGPN